MGRSDTGKRVRELELRGKPGPSVSTGLPGNHRAQAWGIVQQRGVRELGCSRPHLQVVGVVYAQAVPVLRVSSWGSFRNPS